MDFEVGAGNLHDGQMFHELYKKMELSKTQIVAIDAGYKTPGVVREIFLSGKLPAIPTLAQKLRTVFQSASRSYFLLPLFEKIGKEKASRLYIFLLHSPPLKKIKAKNPSQDIPKRVLSTS